jgi:hypothetical protein
MWDLLGKGQTLSSEDKSGAMDKEQQFWGGRDDNPATPLAKAETAPKEDCCNFFLNQVWFKSSNEYANKRDVPEV